MKGSPVHFNDVLADQTTPDMALIKSNKPNWHINLALL
jgi:hypothetical protein